MREHSIIHDTTELISYEKISQKETIIFFSFEVSFVNKSSFKIFQIYKWN